MTGRRGETWQPIETAPREEWINVVILARDNGNSGVMPAVFDGENWRALTIVGMQPYVSPTHWMPLPEPPEGERTSGMAGRGGKRKAGPLVRHDIAHRGRRPSR